MKKKNICEVSCKIKKYLNLGQKMLYLSIFGLEFKKAIAIFEIKCEKDIFAFEINLEFILLQSLVQN